MLINELFPLCWFLPRATFVYFSWFPLMKNLEMGEFGNENYDWWITCFHDCLSCVLPIKGIGVIAHTVCSSCEPLHLYASPFFLWGLRGRGLVFDNRLLLCRINELNSWCYYCHLFYPIWSFKRYSKCLLRTYNLEGVIREACQGLGDKSECNKRSRWMRSPVEVQDREASYYFKEIWKEAYIWYGPYWKTQWDQQQWEKNTRLPGEANSVKKHKGNSKYGLYTGISFPVSLEW